ncbi:polymerase [Bacillus sp. Root239]|nr:polymerase [Bacillus sp. Root239]
MNIPMHYPFLSFLMILSLAIACAVFSIYPITIVFLLIVITSIFMVKWILSKPDRFIYVLFLYIVFQNFFAIILAKYAGGNFTQIFILLKDILTYLALLIAVIVNFKKQKAIWPDVFAVLYLIVLCFYLFPYDDTSFFTKLVQFRQLLTPIILYLLGRFMMVGINRTNKFLKFLIYISMLATLFGFLERYILGDTFWINLGIKEYLSSKGMDTWAYGLGGVPGNFYSYDFYSIIGISLRRMVSFVADPTLFGQFLVLPIAVLMFTKIFKGKKRTIFLVTLILGLILTLSKGGIFSLGIAMVYKIFRTKFKILGYLILTIFLMFTFIILTNASMFSSLPAHLNGLIHNFQLTINNPFGLGLGKAGNFAILYSDSKNEELGSGESYIGMIIGQIGIFSILFVIFLITAINFYRKKTTESQWMNDLSTVLTAVLLGTISSSMISESAISFISSGILFFMVGLAVKNKKEPQSENNILPENYLD